MPGKNKAVGQSLRWTKEDIARRAVIADDDVSSAKAFARRLMPKKFKKLLDAKKENRKP
jgi:hypothetical protein